MFIYLGTFMLSILSISIAEKQKKIKNARFFYAVGIILPCLLAGLRSDRIGTDTAGYLKSMYLNASESDSLIGYMKSTFYHEWKMTHVYEIEWGFSVLVYFCEKLFNSMIPLLFSIELLIIAPIIITLNRFKDKSPVWFGMFVFYFLYYNVTLNAMRQWIAISFVFMAMYYLYKNKIWKYLIIILVAFLFHRSSIVGVFILLFYKIITVKIGFKVGEYRIRGPKLVLILEILLSSMLIFVLNTLMVNVLNNVGLSQYTVYFIGEAAFSVSQLLLQLPVLIVIVMERKRIFEKEFQLNFFLLGMFILNAFISQLSTITENSWRVSLYFGCYSILYFPYLHSMETEKKRKRLILAIFIAYFVVYWYFNFVLLGRHATVPYQFANSV